MHFAARPPLRLMRLITPVALFVAAACDVPPVTAPARLAPRSRPGRDLDPALLAPASLSASISASGVYWAAKDVLIGTFKYPIVYDITLTETLTGTPIYPLVVPVTHGVGGAGCSSGSAVVLNTLLDGDGNPYLNPTFASCTEDHSASGRAVAWGDTYLRLNGISSDACGDSPCISWSASVTANLNRTDGDIMIGLANHPGVGAVDTSLSKPGVLAFYSTSPKNEFFTATPKEDWHFVPDDGSPEQPVCDYYYDLGDCYTVVKQSGTFHMSGYVNGAFKDALNTVHVTLPTAASVKIVTAQGPNPDGSFTLIPGENTISLQADALPITLAPSVHWSVVDAPGDHVVASAPPSVTAGGKSAFVVPRAQDPARLTYMHQTATRLDDKAITFTVTASVDNGGQTVTSAPQTVTMDEIDVLREEYFDLKLRYGVPSRSKFTNVPRGFYNTGDFDKGILDSAFMEHLRALATRFEATATRPFKVNGIYRSPVHNLRHSGDQSTGGTSSGAARNSLHQYGCAADLQTFPFPRVTPELKAQAIKYWEDLSGVAGQDRNLWIEPRVKKQGSAFASTESHVHVSYCPGVVR